MLCEEVSSRLQGTDTRVSASSSWSLPLLYPTDTTTSSIRNFVSTTVEGFSTAIRKYSRQACLSLVPTHFPTVRGEHKLRAPYAGFRVEAKWRLLGSHSPGYCYFLPLLEARRQLRLTDPQGKQCWCRICERTKRTPVSKYLGSMSKSLGPHLAFRGPMWHWG